MTDRSISPSSSTDSISSPYYQGDTTTRSRPTTSRPGTGYTSTTRTRTRPSASTYGQQDIVCAITESRGISPTVGLAFVNVSTTEAVVCQIIDNATYVRTLHKLAVFEPSEILFPTTAIAPVKSKLYSIIEANVANASLKTADRRFWAENPGVDYIQNLAFREDVEAIKVAIGGNYYATCCLAAALKYVELHFAMSFSFHTMRIKYEPSEGSMLIDLSSIHSLELIQNLKVARSKDCLFGLLNQTLTPMGSRLLRGNILQPLTDIEVIQKRYDALGELALREETFYAVRQALKSFLDVEQNLTHIIIIPTKPSIQHAEQSINDVLVLKQYVDSIEPVHAALVGVKSPLLREIQRLCAPQSIVAIMALIADALNDKAKYASKPLEMRHQRIYAVKAGVNGLLDVARQSYEEGCLDALKLIEDLKEAHQLDLKMNYDSQRHYFMRLAPSEIEDRPLPEIFINVYKTRNMLELSTLDLVKMNQKIVDSTHEAIQMSDRVIQDLLEAIRDNIAPLFKISEAIAILDMIASFAYLASSQDYCQPEITDTLAIKDGRHPVHERIHASDKFVPNDVYAPRDKRFQIVTGCNMSGKSVYIRSIALMQIMAQIGSFVPASYATFPIVHQLFARVSTDDSIEANVSTFAAEMREAAFILRNIDSRSLVIIDELGRGTSTRDGLAIAIAIAEALVESKALVWFVTHHRELARFMAEVPGVVNLHLQVEFDTPRSDNGAEGPATGRMTMLYKVADGPVAPTSYGLELAKVVELPPSIIETAECVSTKLTEKKERAKRVSKAIIEARRRKLMLALRETLRQARASPMDRDALWAWLKKLQDEFVARMIRLDEEARGAVDDEEGDEDGDEEGAMALDREDEIVRGTESRGGSERVGSASAGSQA